MKTKSSILAIFPLPNKNSQGVTFRSFGNSTADQYTADIFEINNTSFANLLTYKSSL